MPICAARPAGENELVVDGRGHAYVNSGGFDLMAGGPSHPAVIALVTPTARPAKWPTASPSPTAWPSRPTSARSSLPSPTRAAHRLRYRRRWQPLEPRIWAELRDGVPTGSVSTPRAPSGTPMCRTTLPTRSRRRRNPPNDRARPRRLRLHARRPRPPDPLHPRHRMERPREDVQRRTTAQLLPSKPRRQRQVGQADDNFALASSGRHIAPRDIETINPLNPFRSRRLALSGPRQSRRHRGCAGAHCMFP